MSALLDGEGTLRIGMAGKRRMQYRVQAIIVNTNQAFVERAQSLVGGTIQVRPEGRGRKDTYNLHIRSSILRWLLPQLDLVVKKRQKELVMEALRLKSEWRNADREDYHRRMLQIVEQSKYLNFRSHSPPVRALDDKSSGYCDQIAC
jgi:hypothetical protein